MPELLFSIVIPTYNRASTLGDTLRSLQGQTYPHFEVLVVDDGSTDASAQVVAPFLTDARFRYLPKQNEERAIARNWGIAQAKGRFITFLDSDDGYYPRCLQEAVNFLQQRPKAVFFHLGYEIKDTAGRLLYRSLHKGEQLNEQLLSGNFLSCIGVFCRREILEQDRFNESPALIGSEDYELWLRLAAKYPLYYHPAIGAYMLQHAQRSVLRIDKSRFGARMEALLELVSTEPAIQQAFQQKGVQRFRLHTYLYWSLHLAMGGYKREALRKLIWALKKEPGLVASRKFLGIAKTLIRS
ncbi:glycosyltransferase family 2 protein [Cesiribacter andamanensis]|uniref:Spore coat polysaccharide biosynthesis protein spsA n=1 Tax=Cesiribacter andamanensis AMV16 TaxID=1279009 RepID=M7NZC2_9BACT|nr:glycosyltransferase family A protein [Cesiribacter andamanensis]EMR03699.1 Spore coat polysaccharide biosynthesis protein spsA [Cesiribacter andamanensis AMV16]